MKKIIILLLTAFTLSCCNKDEDKTPLEQLPPATQTGAGTFACYVNGQPFIDTSGGFFNCYYQFVDGEYYFGITGEDKINDLISINIGTLARPISELEQLFLMQYDIGNSFGGAYFSQPSPGGSGSNTTSNNTGTLLITKLDYQNKIVSGTFSFDILHPVTGNLIQIRDGRFDTLFTE